MKLATYFLTCADKLEANKITVALLEKRLAACVKQVPVSSTFHWEGKIQHSSEILLMIDSSEENFDLINKIVAKLHSYDQYVLTAVPISRTTPAVNAWIHGIIGQ
ncbi:MAG TPA: divalent-cation tolerance protein CutA [Candidatus Saccharibacteria bacterium]|nr:divalent-cation tolerance protein CutA [Candidatus Saccharibacteria bacterium]HRK94610.1 divalent-cation tolerance protein CutA [Candidatus Saccharibacteria bacterium]